MTELLPIVSFGKYKDKSVLDLLKDVKYVEWLKNQSWFENHKPIYNIVVNQTIMNTDVNSKTPDHNKLQNLFLDKNIQLNLIKFLYPKFFDTFNNNILKLKNNKDFVNLFNSDPCILNHSYGKSRVQFETKFNWDVGLSYYDEQMITFCSNIDKELIDKNIYKEQYIQNQKYKQNIIRKMIDVRTTLNKIYSGKEIYELPMKNHKEYNDIFEEYKKIIHDRYYIPILKCLKQDYDTYEFNENTYDKDYDTYRIDFYKKLFSDFSRVHIENINGVYKIDIHAPTQYSTIFCELKPLLSDDYPCVLRKLNNQIRLTDRTNNIFCLILKDYVSNITSKEQLITIFNNSGINVIFINDLIDNHNVTDEIEYIKKFKENEQKIIDYRNQIEILENENIKINEILKIKKYI